MSPCGFFAARRSTYPVVQGSGLQQPLPPAAYGATSRLHCTCALGHLSLHPSLSVTISKLHDSVPCLTVGHELSAQDGTPRSWGTGWPGMSPAYGAPTHYEVVQPLRRQHVNNAAPRRPAWRRRTRRYCANAAAPMGGEGEVGRGRRCRGVGPAVGLPLWCAYPRPAPQLTWHENKRVLTDLGRPIRQL